MYKSKIDKTMLGLGIVLTLLLCGMYVLSLVFMTDSVFGRVIEFIIMLAMLVLVWSTYWIKYEFKSGYLYIRSGIFRSKIPYQSITRVSIADYIFLGYRAMASQEAIEVFYPQGIWGSVKISPEYMEGFLITLKEHCPNVKIDSEVFTKYSILDEAEK